jgi:hypothetical protein
MHLGGTVGELKHRMSAKEFGDWIDYFNRIGRCGPVRMFDAPAALLAWKVDNVMGGKTEIKDYLPFHKEPDQVASVEDIFKEFGGVKRG